MLSAADIARVESVISALPPEEALLAALVVEHGVPVRQALALHLEHIKRHPDGQVDLLLEMKDGAVRRLPVDDRLRPLIADAVNGRRTGPLITDEEGEPLEAKAATRALRSLCDVAGVQVASVHEFRGRYVQDALARRRLPQADQEAR